MSNCKTCRWWGFDKTPPPSLIVDSRDQRGRVQESHYEHGACRPCTHPGLVDIEGAEGGYTAVPADGFGLDYPVCDLMTGPEFGCIKWEAASE